MHRPSASSRHTRTQGLAGAGEAARESGKTMDSTQVRTCGGKRTAERFLQNASGRNDCAGIEPAQKDDAVATTYYLIATSLISNTTATFGGNGVRGSAP
ncbi:hypothetical protein GCM10027400_06320 [Pseudoxanthomonas daejeonensis]